MVFITGDIHGNPWPIYKFCQKKDLTENDIIILLGDVGANYDNGAHDKGVKKVLSSISPTILCIHGNHEQRPWNIPGYEIESWKGGKVWVQKEYPNLKFAKDGEIFLMNGLRCIVIGGAYSVDKEYRLLRGAGWWEDEQPSQEIKKFVEEQLRENQIDVILSHTCPFKYEPVEMFLTGVDQRFVDDSTERWLDKIEESTDYKAWFCGHWHTDKRIDRVHFMFKTFETTEYLTKG